MSTLGLELDRLELRVRNLERKLTEMENREVQSALSFITEGDKPITTALDLRDKLNTLFDELDGEETSTELYQGSLEQDN